MLVVSIQTCCVKVSGLDVVGGKDTAERWWSVVRVQLQCRDEASGCGAFNQCIVVSTVETAINERDFSEAFC
jgi:hypothetical protein